MIEFGYRRRSAELLIEKFDFLEKLITNLNLEFQNSTTAKNKQLVLINRIRTFFLVLRTFERSNNEIFVVVVNLKFLS